jgi:NAD(P)-dependent dehydrogenase (short-subunit alcohol dehydrogenase family)
MTKLLTDRRVIVTGGGSGIGEAIVEACVAEGAQVALLGRSRAKLESISNRLEGTHAIVADVTDEGQVEDAISASDAAMGGIDGLVNCAGFASMRSLCDTSLSEWRSLIDIHMTACFLTSRAAAPFLDRAAPHAAILNIASVAGLLPGISGAAYAAAKGGQILFSKALAMELAPRVRVNALCVGPTATTLSQPNYDAMRDAGTYADFLKLFPIGRIAEPSEIAAIAAFLLSRKAAFVTGAAWTVDGGRSLH